MKRAKIILVPPEAASKLDCWARGRSVSAQLALPAKIIQMAAKGALNRKVADELGLPRPTFQSWRNRSLPRTAAEWFMIDIAESRHLPPES